MTGKHSAQVRSANSTCCSAPMTQTGSQSHVSELPVYASARATSGFWAAATATSDGISACM